MKSSATTQKPRVRFGARALNLALGLVLILLGLVLLEGISSTVLFLRDIARASRGPLAERKHTRYDELLGWANVENIEIEDLYGEGALPQNELPGVSRQSGLRRDTTGRKATDHLFGRFLHPRLRGRQ